MTLTELELQILDSIHHQEGEYAVIFKNLDDPDDAFYINKQTVFHAASTMKTPVMIEAFKQVHLGNCTLEDSLIVTDQFRSIVDSSWYQLTPADDSDQDLYQQLGEKLSIKQLVEHMITESSNIASNMLVDYFGAENITQTMKDLGAEDMLVLRGVEDIKAYEQNLSNLTNAQSLLVIFEKLAKGEVITPDASQQMLEVLKRQKFRDVIPAKLPLEVQVAHKTGSISGLHHDSGIVFLPDGRRYVLILLSDQLPDFDKGTEFLSNISAMVYQYMTNKKAS